MTKKSDAPAIRFKGFSDAWEQRKLGDIASDMVAGGDIDKDLILAEGQYPVIANALTGDGIVGYYDKEYRVNAPAVTVTGRGDVGHAKARLVNFTPVVRLLSVKSEHDVFFLENAINTLKIVIESTGVPQLTVPQLAKYEVAFPRQLDEEEHIGAFFKQLDHLITLHQRQPFLQSPPDISLIVQLTPPFYTFSWEQRKLGDMMNVTSVKRIHQSDWTGSGVRFLRARDIVAAAKNEEPDDYLYISKEKYEEYSTLSGKVGVSDLLVTGVGTIGVPYLVRNLEPLYFKDGNIIWFQNSDKIDGKFLFYSFSAEQIQGFINESAGIGTVGTYTIESGKKTPISLPNQIEQAKVGEFFQQLDNLITLHQRQTIVYAVIRSIRKVILAERQYFAPPMVRKSP